MIEDDLIGFSYSRADMLACVEREIALRKRVYPKWVAAHRMSERAAHHQIACLEAVLKVLLKLPEQ